MRDSITFGPTPHGEDCVQLGDDGYELRARVECQAFVSQLTRAYVAKHKRALPEGIRLYVKAHAHDFGTYYEAAVSFNDNDRAALEAALWFDNNCPEFWDPEARQELSL